MTTQPVTARRAAALAGVNERTIRRWITDGKLPATKVAVNRYMIDPTDLPPRKRNAVREELDALKTEIEDLKRRIRALEHSKTSPDALSGQSGRLSALEVTSYSPPPTRPPVDPYSASFQSTDIAPLLPRRRSASMTRPLAAETVIAAVAGYTFQLVADCDRYLIRHGIGAGTCKGWLWLKDAVRTQEGIGDYDLLRQTRQWIGSIRWRQQGMTLRKCTQEQCACQTTLG